MKSQNRNNHRNEQGSALIIVLCIILVISVLVASAVSMSQMSNYFSKIASDRGLSSYYAEGASSRIVWLLLNDKKKNGNPSLIDFNYEEQTGERYLADGSPRSVYAYGADATAIIEDLASGIDISGSNPATNLTQVKGDSELASDVDDQVRFIDKVKDYVDKDVFVRHYGAEKNEYEDWGMPNLPRNADFQFREEIMLIPGCKKFYPADKYGQMSDFQVITLNGLQDIRASKKNFVGVSRNVLLRDGFTPEQVKDILSVRKRWQEEKGSLRSWLENNLPKEVVAKLYQYSFQASGFYKFIVTVKPDGGMGSRTMVFGLLLTTRPGRKKINYYCWQLL